MREALCSLRCCRSGTRLQYDRHEPPAHVQRIFPALQGGRRGRRGQRHGVVQRGRRDSRHGQPLADDHRAARAVGLRGLRRHGLHGHLRDDRARSGRSERGVGARRRGGCRHGHGERGLSGNLAAVARRGAYPAVRHRPRVPPGARSEIQAGTFRRSLPLLRSAARRHADLYARTPRRGAPYRGRELRVAEKRRRRAAAPARGNDRRGHRRALPGSARWPLRARTCPARGASLPI